MRNRCVESRVFAEGGGLPVHCASIELCGPQTVVPHERQRTCFVPVQEDWRINEARDRITCTGELREKCSCWFAGLEIADREQCVRAGTPLRERLSAARPGNGAGTNAA